MIPAGVVLFIAIDLAPLLKHYNSMAITLYITSVACNQYTDTYSQPYIFILFLCRQRDRPRAGSTAQTSWTHIMWMGGSIRDSTSLNRNI